MPPVLFHRTRLAKRYARNATRRVFSSLSPPYSRSRRETPRPVLLCFTPLQQRAWCFRSEPVYDVLVDPDASLSRLHVAFSQHTSNTKTTTATTATTATTTATTTTTNLQSSNAVASCLPHEPIGTHNGGLLFRARFPFKLPILLEGESIFFLAHLKLTHAIG